MEKEKPQKDVVFAVFLIFIGTMFLLNSTGTIGWGIWEYILRFWPIFLILGGIKLILGYSLLTEIVITTLSVLLFLAIGIFSYVSFTNEQITFLPRGLNRYILDNPKLLTHIEENDTEESVVISEEDHADVEKRVLDLKIGASQFNIDDDAETTDYLVLDSNYKKGHIEPNISASTEEGILNIDFSTNSPNRVFWRSGTPTFDFTVGRVETVTDINIDLGAGKGELNLTSLLLSRIEAKVGAGKLDITLGEESVPSDIAIDIGAGEVIINLPEGVGYSLSYELGVGEIVGNGNDIARLLGKNSNYKSDGYETAEKKVTISAKVGVGRLEINNI